MTSPSPSAATDASDAPHAAGCLATLLDPSVIALRLKIGEVDKTVIVNVTNTTLNDIRRLHLSEYAGMRIKFICAGALLTNDKAPLAALKISATSVLYCQVSAQPSPADQDAPKQQEFATPYPIQPNVDSTSFYLQILAWACIFLLWALYYQFGKHVFGDSHFALLALLTAGAVVATCM